MKYKQQKITITKENLKNSVDEKTVEETGEIISVNDDDFFIKLVEKFLREEKIYAPD